MVRCILEVYNSPIPYAGGTASTILYGDYGPAKKEIAEATGASNYNLAFAFGDKVMFHGVVNEEGTEMTTWGFSNSVEVMKLLSSEEVERIREDRDPLDEPRLKKENNVFSRHFFYLKLSTPSR